MDQFEVMNDYAKRFDNFNKEILEIREKDDMVQKIDTFFSEIQNYLPENISYKGYREVINVSRINELNLSNDAKKSKNKKKKIIELDSKETYAKLYSFKFNLKFTKKMENGADKIDKSTVELPLWIPIPVGHNYIIRGSKYSAPLQLIDSLFFCKSNTLILKLMNRAIKMSRAPKIISDIRKGMNLKYQTECFYLYLVKKKISFLLYFLAHFGFQTTLRFFYMDKLMKLVHLSAEELVNADELLPKDKLYFRFGTEHLEVDRKSFESNLKVRQFVASLLVLSKRNLDPDTIGRTSKWLITLSNTISETQALLKGRQILSTFKNVYDANTRDIVKKFTPNGETRQDMFALIRWSFFKFQILSSKAINDLNNKRLRYSEYLILPLVEAVTYKIMKFANTAHRMKDLKRLEDIFKIPKTIILYSMNGSNQASAIKVMQYSDKTSDFDYPLIAKVTIKGKGSPVSKNKYTSVKYKNLDWTHPGSLDIAFGGGDVGLDFVINPTAEVDFEKMSFAEHDKKIGEV